MESLKRLLLVCGIMLAFITGILASFAIQNVYIDKESPLLIGFGNTNVQPSSWLTPSQIEILPDKVILHVSNAVLSTYAATGSMLPTLGENTIGIKIIPKNPEQIQIGDIISYQEGNLLIVHRVVAKGSDSNGVYFVTKGDNNQQTDGKVYWKDVKYVTVALIY